MRQEGAPKKIRVSSRTSVSVFDIKCFGFFFKANFQGIFLLIPFIFAANVLFGWQNIDTTFGIGNAVGPCVCNDEGDCHCRNLQKTIDNNEVILTDGLSTESDESNV